MALASPSIVSHNTPLPNPHHIWHAEHIRSGHLHKGHRVLDPTCADGVNSVAAPSWVV